MDTRDVYMNRMQQRTFYAGAKDVRGVCARRFGKTDGTIGPHAWRVAESMPCGAGIWLGNSRKQLYTRTVPGTIAAIERFYGFKEGVHFGWGRPPKWVPKCIIRPKTYENVIWFANGWLYHLVSLAVSGSANSFTVNAIIADECKFMPKSKIDGEVMPALSGITHPLGDRRFSDWNPYYKSTMFLSDASLTAKGNWLEKEEEKMDAEIETGPFTGKTYRDIQEELDRYADRLIFWNELLREAKNSKHSVMVVSEEQKSTIKALAKAVLNHEGPYRILPNYGKSINKATCEFLVNYKLIGQDTAELLYNHKFLITKSEHFELMQLKKSSKYAEHIRQLRCSSFYFFRASTLDNVDLLGADYIARMKRDLPPVVFAISILNMKQRKSNDGFYANLDIENIHGYIPDDCPAIENAMHLKIASTVTGGQRIDTDYETPDFRELQEVKNCTVDGDVVDNLPLYVSFDYNANINWIVTGQVYKRDGVEAVNVLSSMFVKNEKKIHALLADWNRYYSPHKGKNKTVYYFYDSTAKFRGYAVEGQEDFKDTIISVLRKYNWEVVAINMGRPMAHEEKYKIINEGLGGYSYPAIRINRENNEALIIAMCTCEVSVGYNGFRKDKSGEKLSEYADDSVRLEYRTDGTDAFDQLYIGCKFYRMRMSGLCLPGGR